MGASSGSRAFQTELQAKGDSLLDGLRHARGPLGVTLEVLEVMSTMIAIATTATTPAMPRARTFSRRSDADARKLTAASARRRLGIDPRLVEIAEGAALRSARGGADRARPFDQHPDECRLAGVPQTRDEDTDSLLGQFRLQRQGAKSPGAIAVNGAQQTAAVSVIIPAFNRADTLPR